MKQKPVLKGPDLVNRLVGLKGKNIDEIRFQVTRERKEAIALMPYDPGFANFALGMIYFLEGNFQKMNSYFKTGVGLLPGIPVIYINYAASLGEFSQYNKAADNYMKAFEIDTLTQDQLESAIAYTEFSGRFSESLDYRRLLMKLYPQVKTDIEMTEKIIATLKSLNISENHIIEQTKLAEDFWISQGVFPELVDITLSTEKTIQFEYFIKKSAEEVEILQEQFDDLVWQKGLSKVLKDEVTADFFPTHTEEIERSLDISLQKSIPVDTDQMNRISKLVEGVEF
ncbi:MAG: hypothetical protein HQ517_07560 [SAR324 cluster bacterium]|nr:hypothetical protein [SAR324 cluster bacterium]